MLPQHLDALGVTPRHAALRSSIPADAAPDPATLGGYLRVVAPHLSSTLVSPEALTRIAALADSLPAAILAGFESRLDTPEANADFLVCFVPSEAAFDVLADAARPLPSHLGTVREWSRIIALCRQIRGRHSALHAAIDNLWLEFDLGGNPAAIPIPSVFFGPRSPVTATTADGCIERVIETLTGRAPTSDLADQLRRCVLALPSEGGLFQIGLMLSRAADALRLCIRLPATEIVPYVQRLDWSGSTSTLLTLMDELTPLVDVFALALDIGAGLGPRIGLECSFSVPDAPYADARMTTLLGHLVKRKLCVDGKRQALLAWPGTNELSSAAAHGAANLAGAAATLHHRLTPVVLRGWSHVKVVLNASGALEAKAYYGFKHAWQDAALADTHVTRH